MTANCLTSCPASLQEFGQESKTETIGSHFQYENTVCINFHLSSYVNPTVLRIKNLIFITQEPPVTHSEVLWMDAVERLGFSSCPSVMLATSINQKLMIKEFDPWVMSSYLIWKWCCSYSGMWWVYRQAYLSDLADIYVLWVKLLLIITGFILFGLFSPSTCFL